MFLYDSHAHFEGTPVETETVLRRAEEAGVRRILAMGGSAALNAGAIAAQKIHPDQIRLALGFDRDLAQDISPEVCRLTLDELRARVTVHCIGEIGLDYHYQADTADLQCALFEMQLRYAAEHGLPVSIHTREADGDTLRLLDEVPWDGKRIRGVIHCFTGGAAFGKELLARGFMMSFSGIVTFKNAPELRAFAKEVPEDRLLIETDSPYLAPVPKRGKPNEPAYVRYVAECLAQVRGRTVEEIAAITAGNAVRFLKDEPLGS